MSRIFQLVDKTTDLMLMSHGLNHERLLSHTPQLLRIFNFISSLKPQQSYQLGKKFCFLSAS